MRLTPVNSFIFEMIYCKRPAKSVAKAMANGCDICANPRSNVALTL